MKRKRLVGIHSSNGELHYILEETTMLESSRFKLRLIEAEGKELTKKEASKPLFIMRED